MTTTADSPAAPFLRDIAELSAAIRAQAPGAEERGRLDEGLVHELKQRRFFRLWIPRSVGGEEMDLPSSIEVFEAMSYEDGVAGWTIMIGAGGGLFAPLLPKATAEEIFGPIDAVIAGSGAPAGTAHREGGKYRVDGRWRFASGVYHATWFTANTVVHEGGEPALGPDGERIIRAIAVPASSVEILGNWDVTGMRATASQDFAMKNLVVDEDHTFNVVGEPRDPGPLYRYPFTTLTSLSTAAVTLGIARRALDEWAAYARSRTPRMASEPLAALPFAASRYAEAWVTLEAARSLWREQARTSWDVVASGGELDEQANAKVDLAANNAAAAAAHAAGLLYDVAGMEPLSVGSAFGRCWRDLHAVRQHGSVAPARREADGLALLRAGSAAE
jgi:alkylation response protein AidB-like acyl-CoA dehydrogenase